jgi:S1-C subfamily serine protease
MAKTITETLVKSGKVRRGQLGITVVRLNSQPAKDLGITETKGVGVAQVKPGSAADQAGLKKGDVITAFNGTEINEPNVFRNLVASTAPDTEVTLTIRRDGREQQVRAKLGELVSAPDRDTEQPR